MSCLIDIKHYTRVLLNIFSNLDSIFSNELAVGNVNTKSWEKVNSFARFTKVGGNILYV